MRRELRRTPELHALGLRTRTAIASARLDQLALELGQAAKHSQHQSTVRRRGISPRIGERLEAGTGLADRIEDVEQIARRSSEPIEPRHQQQITSVETLDQLGEFRP